MTETKRPNRKMAAAGTTGAMAIVLVWVAGQIGLDMPAEVGAAFAAIAAWAAGYLRREDGGGKHARE